jgi:hypothetical protein
MVESIYSRATGELGWGPDAAWDTPLPQIASSLRAHYRYLRRTNPFRTQQDVDDERIEEMKPDPDSGKRLFEALRKLAKPLPKKEDK